MTDDRTKREIAAALDRLSARVKEPRVFTLSADDQALLDVAIERVRGQWLGPSEPVLTVALAGGTGAGKSTLINALAGKVIAEASEIRPTTRHIQVYHHREDSLGSLTEELATEASFVPHDRPELRHKMLVDAPDLDSFVVRHRATTKALLQRAGLVFYVFSPERYLEERTWSVLRQETEFSACAAVLNKSDRIGSPDELEQITDDLREHFKGVGLGEIRIFRVCARAHVPEHDGRLPGSSALVDDMEALRAFIERELQASEIARLLRGQRRTVIAHLRGEVDRVAPEGALGLFLALARDTGSRAEAAADRLTEALSDQLSAIETELAPLLKLRRHERFWGPFRIWLAAGDFLSFGLTNLIRRTVGRPTSDRTGLIERILSRGGILAADEMLHLETNAFQDRLFARGLPIDRWRQITSQVDASELVKEIATEIEVNFDLSSARVADQGEGIVKVASTLGSLVPSGLVIIGLVVMTRDVFIGNYAGLPMLWHLLAMTLLFFVALQGIVSVLLPGGSQRLGPAIGARAVQHVVRQRLGAWFASYRAELQADLADFHEPLKLLENLVNEDRDPLVLANSDGIR